MNNQYNIRTKSSDKIKNSIFNDKNKYNNNINNNNINIISNKYQQINPQNNNNFKKIINKPKNNINKSNEIKIEGDLNNFDYNNNFKNNNFKNNLNFININNYNKKNNINPFEIKKKNSYNYNFNILQKFNNKSGNNNNKHLPRKSPIPIPRSYLQNNNKLNNQINQMNFNNKNLFNSPYNFYNNNIFVANNLKNIHNNGNNRALTPLLRTSSHKLNINKEKQRLVSKSPILGKSSILKKFKKFHILNYNGNNYYFHNHNNSLNNYIRPQSRPSSENKMKNSRLNNNSDFNNTNKKNKINNNQNITNNIRINIFNNNSHSNEILINNPFQKNSDIFHNISKQPNYNNMMNNTADFNNLDIIKNKNNSFSKEFFININNSQNNKINNNNNNNFNNFNNQTNNIRYNSRFNNINSNSNNTNQNKPNNLRSLSTNNPHQFKDIIKENINNNFNNNNNINRINNNYIIQKKIKNIYKFTHVGFDGETDKEHNQDISFIEKNFTGHPDYIYMSVCDGHGVEGHEVSGFIKKILPKNLSQNLYNKNLLTTNINEKNEINNIICNTFLQCNEQLIENENINSTFSGTTCVSLIYTPSKLIVPNIGDSRAVLGKYDISNNIWSAIDLSRDHKPTEKDEAERIIRNGGRIKPFTDDETGEFIGPQRVWIKEDDVPGLAMTRSFGDRVAAIAGTISEPEIKEFELKDEDKFIIIASDGIWEFISSQECVEFIKDFYEKKDLKGCLKFLLNESSKRWIKEEEVIDDITAVLIFFEN